MYVCMYVAVCLMIYFLLLYKVVIRLTHFVADVLSLLPPSAGECMYVHVCMYVRTCMDVCMYVCMQGRHSLQ